ncbi:MAG: NUDIX hydrolase [Patescibacteria group bacterium]|nr:NUDIX hydrolase [Patescibacteria group bacterium]
MKSWKLLSHRRAYTSPWLSVDKKILKRPNGSVGEYYIVNRKPVVIILARRGGKFLLVNEYRAAVGKRVWSFPAGYTESKNFLSDAKRELKEETGFRAKTWLPLGKFHHNPGLLDDLASVFLATGLIPGQAEREPGEGDLRMKWFTLKQVRAKIKKNEVFGAGFLASLLLFSLKRKRS